MNPTQPKPTLYTAERVQWNAYNGLREGLPHSVTTELVVREYLSWLVTATLRGTIPYLPNYKIVAR